MGKVLILKLNEYMKTKGELEAEIGHALIRFKKEVLGRGPLSVKAWLLDDMVVVRLAGVLTTADQKLVKVEDRRRGRDLLKQVRMELIEDSRPILDNLISEILGVKVVSVHTDISTKTGESVLLFSLASKPVFT